MAFAFVSNRGTGQNKSSGTTLVVNPTATLAVGALVTIRANSDNFTTVNDVETTQHSVADSKSNVWTKVKEKTRTAGVAADGCTGSMWFSQITVPILTSDTITLTLANAVTAKVLAIDEFSTAAGVTVSLAGSNAATAGGSTTYTATISGLASTAYLFVGSFNPQLPTPIGSFVLDSDYTATSTIGTTGSGAATNVATTGGYRLLSGTGDTFNGTVTSSSLNTILGAFLETVNFKSAWARNSNQVMFPGR